MLKKLAALGLTAALALSPMAALAQATDTTAPAADAKPMAEKPMKPKHHMMKKHVMKKHVMKKKMMEKETPPPADAPKT
jgi:hypothetical protein